MNPITTTNQGAKITDREKDKNKDKSQPILPYYIISNRLYSSHYNSPKNPKSFLHKKNNINNLKDININSKNNNKKIIKSNSTLSSYNNFNYNHYSKHNLNANKHHNKKEINSVEQSPTVKDKILNKSKKNSKSGHNHHNKNKKINFDCNLLIKKISNPNKQKSMHDIFYNDLNNCYSLNTSEAMKKNKKMIMTSLNNSKNSSQEKGKINSKKKFQKFNYIEYNNKINGQEKNGGSKKISLNNSSKYISNKVQNTNNNNNNINTQNNYSNSNKNGKLYKKNHAKLVNNELYYPQKKKQTINFYMNYLKGVNNIILNNNSCKSVNSTGNITYKKPGIKTGMSEIINKDNNYNINILSNPTSNKNSTNVNSSMKSNKYNQGSKINTARSLSINTKYDKKNDFLNYYNYHSNNKHSKKNSLNNTKLNLKKYLAKFGESPFYKYCHKTTGNYFPMNNGSVNSNIKNYKTIKSPYNYNNKLYLKNNNGMVNPTNSVNNKKKPKIDNNKLIDTYTSKAKKIIKDGLQEISKIRNDFAKHFTANNSPNQKNNIIINKKDSDNIHYNNSNGNINININGNFNNSSMRKNSHNNNSVIKKKSNIKNSSIKKDSVSKVKPSPKKNNIKIKKEKVKQLTQNNSKLYLKKILEPKNKNEKIPPITNITTTNNQSLTHSSHSGLRDSYYYLRESQKLSNYIKNYYSTNKKYPETNLSFYKYGRLIGQGAFGKVNLGLNILTGRVVAIKSFNKSNIDSNSENMKKILYETNLMKKLNHPNVTKILELFEDKEYILIIMEYINGGNLFSFLKKRRKVSEKTAKFLFKQIILGIKYIHSHNIVHRDIKLENILIDLNNKIKICDFGIGRVLNDPNQLLFDQCGTPMYIAPEILLSTKQNGYKGFPVDIWSSGIALYILLSGSLPFSFKNGKSVTIEESEKNNDNSEELQFSIINNEPKQIENISEEAKNLLNGLLNKNPDKRLTCEQILAHPWLKGVGENLDNNKYHLFTKAEMKMLSKTYVDYRKDKSDNLKENFTLSNLFTDSEKNKKNEKNEESKSSILAPFNSVNESNDDEDEDNYYYNKEIITDDLYNKNIRLENEIITIGNKVKEFNMLYEMNNNCEVDNGIIINSKTNTLTSGSNHSLVSLSDSFTEKCDYLLKKEKKKSQVKNNKKNKKNYSSFGKKKAINVSSNNGKKIKNNKKNNNQINNILNQMESLGYNKQYVQECVKNNVLCHASTVYFLMLNYDKI